MKTIKSVTSILLFAVLLMTLCTGCTYYPPEGYTEKHHTFDEVLAFAKSLDPNAEVSEEYTDTTIDDWNRNFREWPAVIYGRECHVSSVGDMVWNSGFLAGEFAKQYYVIDTDYDYYVLKEIVAEHHPDWKMEYDDINSRYNWNNLISVQTTCTENRQLTDEELESVWQAAYEIYAEYSAHPVRREAWFVVRAPLKYHSQSKQEDCVKTDSEKFIIDFSEEGKRQFFEEYREAWALLESGLPIE